MRLTEIRVDGGEWQPYVEEETILNSAADLGRWSQAGPGGLNWMTEEGGFARTFGGLGMPWYPVKDFGDFSLKLQWRDSSTGTNGNAGVFVRFPHPEEAVSRPAAERFPCQVGSATSQPAWVAIFCGHEIQINDHQGDAQKTGSIYNFSPNDATAAQIQPRGTWVEYEVRVVGQQYTIIRNGNVIKSFLNSPDQPSSRPGDPSTSDRQFARGYIGLQNHGNPDVIDFRNVRVLSLDEGSVQGPVTVEGDGEHTVEYRSTDAAGNEEAIKSHTFTIGAADETPPVTTHELDPANPGAGGTYSGPVGVTLSAIDPVEGGPEPATHDVNATGITWTPNAVDAVSGDVVRWNFPETRVVPTRRVGDRAGRGARLGRDAGHHRPGPARRPLGLAHARRGGRVDLRLQAPLVGPAGRWTGMVGTLDVAAGAGSEASGVDFTEYPLDGGAPVQLDNDEDEDPFETTFTVSDRRRPPRRVQLDRRRRQRGGDQVGRFSIAAANPGTGAPPMTPPVVSPPLDDGADERPRRPRVRAPKTMNVRRVIRRGLPLRVSCAEACRARSVLRLSGERIGASKRLRISAGGSRTLVIRLKRHVRRDLLAAMRQAGVRRVTATAITTIATDDVTRAFPVRITLRR